MKLKNLQKREKFMLFRLTFLRVGAIIYKVCYIWGYYALF